MLWDLFQEYRISSAETDATEARQAAHAAEVNQRDLRNRIEQLERVLCRAELVLMATTELLRDRLGVTDEELAAKVAEIDARDGVEDGRVMRATSTCPNCQRVNQSARRRTCLYCGTELVASGV